ERRTFNETVQKYNTTIKRFPNSIFASVFGFGQKQYFQSTPGAEVPPKVQF
ncbi:MAG TPA: LemA family protein, partial [Ignavibacteriaceae bacterium]